MFGSLFEEDENVEVVYRGDRNGKTTENEKKIILRTPPPPRPSTNMCGIQNQGATCYLNSLLQTLLFTPEFRDGLFALSQEELGWLDTVNENSSDKKLRVIPVELQKLFSQLLLADIEAVSTTDLTDSFGWVDNEELQQHDVQELNRILFSAIEKSLVGTSGMDLISRLYRGTVVNQVECLECGHISEREESFFDLTLTVSGHSSLESSLKSSFLFPEKMDGNNRYYCSGCDKLVDANKALLQDYPLLTKIHINLESYNPLEGIQTRLACYTVSSKATKLRRLPPVLTLSLLRFNYNPMKGERFKDTSKFSFPTRLDLTPFRDSGSSSEKEGDTKSSNVYQLLSVVVHKGNAHGGHYHAYVRDVGHFGRWNHSSLEEKTNGEKEAVVLHENFENEGEMHDIDDKDLPVPAALLRDILRRGNHIAPSDTIPLVDLCEKLSELTCGSSWSAKFQPKFGHLSKFLASNSSLFYFNKVTRTVGLQPQGVKPIIPSYSNRESYGSGGDGSATFKGTHRRKKRKKKGRLSRKKKGVGDGRRVSAGTRRDYKMEVDGDDDESIDGDCDDDCSSSENGEVIEGCHWFDFDDASVTAIPASAIEAQFFGRESAYMLFYRREGLGNKKLMKGNKAGVVPEHLAKMVEEKNLQLKKEREEYEKALHEVFVRVLPSSGYVVRNSGLHKRSGNGIFDEIRIPADKRWTVDRLNKEILKACCGDGGAGWEEECNRFYTCQDTPCGLHLVEPLLHSKTHPDTRLVKDVVEDGFRLFAWNGVDVGGVPYHAGPENEPILLRILLPSAGGVCHEITHGFPKSTPLSHVRVAIAQLCQAPLLSLHLSYEPPPEPKEMPCKNMLRRGAVGCQETFIAKLGKCNLKTQTNDVNEGNFTLARPIRLSLLSNEQSLAALNMASGGRILVACKSLSGNSSPEGNTAVVWIEDWTQLGIKINSKRELSDCYNNIVKKESGSALVQWGIEGRVVRIEVPMETVSQLKNIAIKQLDLPSINYRLRKQEDENIIDVNDALLNAKIGLKCPLQEYLVLNEANIHSGSKIILEEGNPVGDNQIWLSFSPPPCIGDSPREFELIVDKKNSIRELLKEMLAVAHLTGEEWHIRKTNWNGDLGDPLDDLNATVSEESLTHGQHLNLCEKSLPNRGFIRLHLFLCSHPNDSNKLIQSSPELAESKLQYEAKESTLSQNKAFENGDEDQENKMTSRRVIGKWTKQQLEKPICLEMAHHALDNLGCLEVDQELTLDQLKEMITTLCPRISSLNLSSPQLIRLRLLRKTDNSSKGEMNGPEIMRFSRVLRNNWYHCASKISLQEQSFQSNQLTLSSLQVHTGAIIGIQVLSAEEELGPHDVILELCQHIQGSKTYFPPVELLWSNTPNIVSDKCRTSLPNPLPQCQNNLESCDFVELSTADQKSNCSSSEPSQNILPLPNSSCQTSQEDINPLLNFKKSVASKLGLSQDNIILAKYLSAKKEWSVFLDPNVCQDGVSCDKSTPKSKKKGCAESPSSFKSARHCLANLSDGDIIGVKDITGLKKDEEIYDFSLSDESLVKNSNDGNKKNNGISNGQGQVTMWNETPQKSERGIHIRVVDYS